MYIFRPSLIYGKTATSRTVTWVNLLGWCVFRLYSFALSYWFASFYMLVNWLLAELSAKTCSNWMVQLHCLRLLLWAVIQRHIFENDSCTEGFWNQVIQRVVAFFCQFLIVCSFSWLLLFFFFSEFLLQFCAWVICLALFPSTNFSAQMLNPFLFSHYLMGLPSL